MPESTPTSPTLATSTTSVSDMSDITAALNEMFASEGVGNGNGASEVMGVSEASDIVSKYIAKHSAETTASKDKDKEGKDEGKEGKPKGNNVKGKDKKGKGTDNDTNDGDKAAEKLAFWQALCIEFGLVQHPSAPEESEDLPAMPTTLTQTRKLLKQRAHVNLVDYVEQRALNRKKCREYKWGQYRHLVFETETDLVKYTIAVYDARRKALKEAKTLEKTKECKKDDEKETNKEPAKAGKKIFPKKLAKAEGLQPLMRHILGRVR